jgi:CheY-like chemotaxis protein
MQKPVILMVDDDKTVLDSLNNQLRSSFGRELKYETASSVAEAWDILEETLAADGHIALIISDWMMPSVKGDQFLIEVTQKYPSIPQVMLSGFADEESVERARQGAHLLAYITKPWQANDIVDAVRKALESQPAT